MLKRNLLLALVPIALLIGVHTPAALAEPVRVEMRRPAAPTATVIEDGRTETRLLRVGHIPAVMATINGKGPYLFAVDTGTSASLLVDSAFAEEHGFEVVGEMTARDGMSGAEVPMSLMEVGTLEIGGARFEGLVGSSHDFSPIATALGADMAGIIGFGLFADCVFTIDFPRNVLVIEEGVALSSKDAGVVPLVAGVGIADIPIEINGQQRRTHIDTGSRGGVTIAHEYFESLEFSTEPKVAGRGRTVASSFDIVEADLVGTLTIAGFTLDNPPLMTTNIMDHGNVGMQLLSNFALTFDQRNSLMRFERPRGAGPLKIKEHRKRLGIQPSIRGDHVVLEAVMPNSPGFEAGLRKGDRIVAINGKPIAELRGPALGKEMRVRPSIVFVVEREGKERAITVTME